MITVNFQLPGRQDHILIMEELPRNTPLRDMQQDLCTLFKMRFPAMAATLQVDGKTFTDFDESPFAGVSGDVVEATVVFEENKFDPWFYDFYGRRVKEILSYTELQQAAGCSLDEQTDEKSDRQIVDVAFLPPWRPDL